MNIGVNVIIKSNLNTYPTKLSEILLDILVPNFEARQRFSHNIKHFSKCIYFYFT